MCMYYVKYKTNVYIINLLNTAGYVMNQQFNINL